MTTPSGVTWRAEPEPALLDDHVDLVVEGVPPDSDVVVTARTRDETSRAWAATAELKADGFGRVEVGKAMSLRGSYTGIDPTGLFWAMTPVEDGPPSPFEKDGADPVVVELDAAVGGRTVAATTVRRLLAGPGVGRIELDLPDVVGCAYRPSGEGPFPGVLVLGGSGGALLEGAAALLASRGVAAVAVSYFGRPGLPAEIADIPLEPLVGVLGWLRAQTWVSGRGLGVVGTSKGGEAALLLGVHVPDVRAVVTVNGSGVHYQAVTARGPHGATWTLEGTGIDFLPLHIDLAAAVKATVERPFETTAAFLAALDAPEAERATIPVERINGALLLIAGEDDRVWPSRVLADRVATRMAQHGRADDVAVLAYADAGHNLSVPNLPSHGTLSTKHGLFRRLGGTAVGNARAQADAWTRTVDFLLHQLR